MAAESFYTCSECGKRVLEYSLCPYCERHGREDAECPQCGQRAHAGDC